MKKSLVGLGITLLIVFLAVAALLFTQPGFSLLIHAGERLSKGALQVGTVHGSLRESFSLENIRYNSEGVEVEIGRFVYTWRPAALLKKELHVSSVVIKEVLVNTKAGKDKAESKESQGVKLPDIALPLGIMIGELRGVDITIAAEGSVVAELEQIHLELSGNATELNIATLSLKGEGLELEMGGTVAMDRRWPVDIVASWRYTTSGLPELQGTCGFSETVLDGSVRCAATTPFTARLDGSYGLDDGVRWQADVEADDADPSVFFPDIPGLLDIAFSTKGKMHNEELLVSLNVEKIDGTLLSWPLALKGSAELENDALTVSGLELTSGSSHIRVEGAVLPALDMEFAVDVADVGALVPQESDTLQSDVQGTLQGRGTVSGSFKRPLVTTVIEGRNLSGQGVSVASLRLEGEAEAAIDGEMDVAVTLEDVRREDQYADAVSLDLDGNIAQHAIKLNVLRDDLSLIAAADGGLQAGMWQGVIEEFTLNHSQKGTMELAQPARLAAGKEKVSLDEFCLQHEAARVCMAGRLADMQWQASVVMWEADPSYFFADWPGRVNLTLRGQGDVSSPQLEYFLEIAELSGEVKGLSLDGGGTIEQNGILLRFSDINLEYGDAVVALHGIIEETFDVEFDIDIPRIKELVPQMQGMFEASGQLYGSRKSPALELDFTTENGAGPSISWAGLQGQIDVDVLGGGALKADIRGDNISAGTVDVSEMSLSAHGTRIKHAFSLDAVTSLGTLAVRGEGSYGAFWQGALNNVDIFMEKYGSWKLEKPAAFAVGGERSRLESFCLVDDEASVCVDGSLAKAQGWTVRSKVDGFPLNMLSQSGLSAIPLEGKLQSTIEAGGDGARLLGLDAWIKIPQLDVKDPRESGQQYQFSDISLSAAIEQQSLNIDLGSRFAEKGRLVGNLSLENFNDHLAEPGTLPFAGQLDFDLEDLTFITILTGSRLDPTGKLVGHFEFEGTPTDPVARGNIDLREGKVLIADLGITLEDIVTRLEATGKSLQYTISADSGPGSVKSDGVLSFDAAQGLALKGSLQGADFDVMATDEYTIRISPEVQVEVDGRGGTITGDVHVPYARVAPEFGTSGGVTVSKDIVMVDDVGQQAGGSKQFVTDLTVSLGDDVKVVAYGLKGNVTGEIEILDEPGKNLAAQGELTVPQGKFALYSAELDITQGRLLFSGGAVENPGVDFRAQRKIQEKVVGVDVTGTAQNLEFQFFSDPAMDQSKILSYILAGRSMYGSNGGGDTSMVEAAAKALGLRGVNTVTNALEQYIPIDEVYIDSGSTKEDVSIVLGTNISEDLFVGYNHNFFDSTGEFKARYNLGYNFSLETKSSVEATSGDIIYTIKK